MSDTEWPKTLYPHAGERVWSTEMRDEWKRDLAVEVVPADELAKAERELHKFQQALTATLAQHGVPAMSSWQDAIDWLAANGGAER